jgi:predicted Rossmann fold nucleotide-binding protein DprA/Smf involved in DNA uptake
MEILGHIGNLKHLELHKIAFLCSRQIPASAVLKCYDWAITQREAGNCIISGFHSQIEKDVLHYLLKGTQPIIIVLARGLKQKLEPEFVEHLEQGRLLIITPFESNITRVSKQTALLRNQFMMALADDVVVGYVKDGGSLERLIYTTRLKVGKIN